MANAGSTSPPMSPPFRARRKGFARRCERYCCNVLTYFPLLFIYGLSSWAVWVEASIGFLPVKGVWTGYTSSAVGIILYILLNWSYTVAVFTSPGSPLNPNHGYTSLPNQEAPHYTSFTVKSTGDIRYCKKCHTKKPDRAHHCSTCGRCVLKMDHHCPWLATCVGLRNYKAFLLFLIYTSIFCWICLAVSATWVWSEVLSEGKYLQNLMPVNYILLAVISGIIGLVLTCFTVWHIVLACKGQTTIESLEKTRYLSPIRQGMRQQFQQRNYVAAGSSPDYTQQLAEIHANALPGVTRPEEGDSRSPPSRSGSPSSSPAHRSLSRNLRKRPYSPSYADEEREREYDRYEDYLDELDSEKLPNAFDLGWRRNLLHVFGEKPSLWLLPVCNTTGDGWTWEPSPKWLAGREEVARDRSASGEGALEGRYDGTTWAGKGIKGDYSQSNRNSAPHALLHSGISMQPLDRRRQAEQDERSEPGYESGSDDGHMTEPRRPQQQRLSRQASNVPPRTSSSPANWNDLPDDMLAGRRRTGTPKASSQGPSRPGRSSRNDLDDWRPG